MCIDRRMDGWMKCFGGDVNRIVCGMGLCGGWLGGGWIRVVVGWVWSG